MTGPVTDGRIVDLWDFLSRKPKGVTIHQIADHLKVNDRTAADVVHHLREWLGDTENVNVVCDPDPANPNGPWLYRLAGTLDEVQPWAQNRVGDAETRIRTLHSMVGSVVTATKGTTTEGKRARLLKKGLGRLVEDLDDISDEVGKR